MNKFGKSFTFNGHSSTEFHLVLAAFDTQDEMEMGITRSVEHGEFAKYRSRPNHTGAVYDDVLQFDITLIKDPCYFSSQKEMEFTRREVGKLNAWLTGPQYPSLFHMEDYPDDTTADEQVDYFVTVGEVSSTYLNGVCGLTYTLYCDSPYGYSPEIINTLTCTTALPYDDAIVNNSDELQSYEYPTLEIVPKSTGKLTWKNITDDNKSLTIDVLQDNNIYLDCRNLVPRDDTGALITLESMGITDTGNLYWPRLCAGENHIQITGDAIITMKHREARKVGAY